MSLSPKAQSKLVEDEMVAQGKARYPSPYWTKYYEFPKGYGDPEMIKRSLASVLGVMAKLNDISQRNPDFLEDLEADYQDTNSIIRAALLNRELHRLQFPMYLLTRPLVSMLLNTDSPADYSIDLDARPPYQACTLVMPTRQIVDDDGDALVYVSWLDITQEGARRFIVHCHMNRQKSYTAQYMVRQDGTLGIRTILDDLVPDALMNDETTSISLAKGDGFVDRITGLLLVLMLYLNLEKTRETETVLKVAKPKKEGMPVKSQVSPAIIGTGLKPSGFATHGTHASPTTHIRRGHMRWVRFGEGKVDKRRQWIHPCLVNGPKPKEETKNET